MNYAHQNKLMNNTENLPKNPVIETILLFTSQLDSINSAFPLSIGILIAKYNKSVKEYNKFLTKYGVVQKKNTYKVKSPYGSKIAKLHETKEINKYAISIVSESLLISLVAEFDSFRSRLIKHILLNFYEVMFSSEIKIGLKELAKYNSIKEARDSIVDIEVDSIIRKPITDFIDWVESYLKIEIKSTIQVWPEFVEIIQRRHLLVHNKGIVNEQYLRECKKHNCDLDKKIVLGTKLGVDSKYFKQSYLYIFEVGIKLSQLLWRKFYPNDIALADMNLNNDICVKLLSNKQYSLAYNLLSFATTHLKQKLSNEAIRKSLFINKAIACYKMDKKQEMLDLLSQEDWSASSSEYKLAVAVLKEEYDTSVLIMKEIGKNGRIDKDEYLSWPLFENFRKTKLFQQSYKEIFGVEVNEKVLSIID